MATAGDRLQIVIGAKDELSAQLRETRRELTQLGRTANEMHRRMEAGEQGLQDEYEQTRVDLERTREKYESLRNEQRKNTAELKQLTEGTRSQGRAYDYMNRQAEELKRTTRSMQAGWGKMVGAVAAVTGAVAAAGFAFRFLGDSITEAREQRKAMAQLEAVMKSMGRTEAPEAIGRLVEQLARMSGLEDDEVLASVNLMLTFGEVTGKTFMNAERAAVDLAAAFHMDLQSATVMVGKALNNPIGGLTSLMRVGVAFTEQQKEQIKAMMEVGDLAGAQAIIMAELKRQVDGSAAAQVDAIDKWNNAFKDFKQQVGDILLDTAGKLMGISKINPVKGLRDATKWLKKNAPQIELALMSIAAATLRIGEYALRAGEWQAKAYAAIMSNLGSLLKVVGLFIPKAGEWGDALIRSADGALKSSDGLREAADSAAALADKTFTARDRVEMLNTALDKVDGKKVRVKIETTMTDVWAAVDEAMRQALDFENRFAGGPVLAGNTYVVGEVGPELFVPNVGMPQMIGESGPEIRDFATSGVVIPNHLLAPAMAVQAPAVVVPAAQPAGVQIGEVHVHDRVDLQREMDALLARQRRIASERS